VLQAAHFFEVSSETGKIYMQNIAGIGEKLCGNRSRESVTVSFHAGQMELC
jgi:hypothetical protein